MFKLHFLYSVRKVFLAWTVKPRKVINVGDDRITYVCNIMKCKGNILIFFYLKEEKIICYYQAQYYGVKVPLNLSLKIM